MKSVHEPVLLHEVVEYLAGARGLELGAASLEQGERSTENKANPLWYLDGTLGGAGHAQAIAHVFNGNLNIVGLDRDLEAIARAKETLQGKAKRVILENEDFRNLDKVLDKHSIAKVDLILLDLGISSDELDASGKGFTFRKDEPLLMTMGDPKTYLFTAKDIVNNWQEEDIANVIFAYGEERYGRRIARKIIEYREKKRFETSGEFAEFVKLAVPSFYRHGKIHPATKTFQALRIAVNDELNAIKEGLKKGFEHLNKGGRMAVISFHSLEDRIVKEFYKEKAEDQGAILTKRPISPSAQEIAENPRSRSAKLRVIEKR